MAWNKITKPMPRYVIEKIRKKLKGKLKFPDRFFTCEYCGIKKRIHDMCKFNRSKKHYCSILCAAKAKIGKKLTEEHKAKIGKKSLGNQHNLGKTPWNKGMIFPEKSGCNCRLWKGGTTKVSIQIRTSERYRIWRRLCMKRDNYICQWCGKKGGNLIVHHILPFSNLLIKYKIRSFSEAKICDGLWDIDNGMTLCIPCHSKTETYPKNLQSIKLKSKS